jgi:hypothetical protein
MSESGGEAVSLAHLEFKPAEFKPIPRGKEPKPNPFAEPLERSWDEPLSVDLVAKEALSARGMLRKAAMRAGHGVSVQFRDIDTDKVVPETKVKGMVTDTDPGPVVRVVFFARELIKAARREDDETGD